MYDPNKVSESENEARWQAEENIIRIEHSMLLFYQPEDYRNVMLRSYREYFRRELEPRQFFEENMDLLSSMLGLTAS
jgi:hypothetical protein